MQQTLMLDLGRKKWEQHKVHPGPWLIPGAGLRQLPQTLPSCTFCWGVAYWKPKALSAIWIYLRDFTPPDPDLTQQRFPSFEWLQDLPPLLRKKNLHKTSHMEWDRTCPLWWCFAKQVQIRRQTQFCQERIPISVNSPFTCMTSQISQINWFATCLLLFKEK